MSLIGAAVPRSEDARFLTGSARYIADLEIDGLVEAVLLRSPLAHGIVREVDTTDAEAMSGVVAAWTAADVDPHVAPLSRPLYRLDPDFVDHHNVDLAPYREPLLAGDRVRRAGDAVALVLAANRHVAEDARDLVRIEIEPLDVVADPESAMADDAPQLYEDIASNIHARFDVRVGAPRTARQRRRKASGRFRIHRAVGSPLENRGVVATWDGSAEELTVWSTTQIPHTLRSFLAEMLPLRMDQIRVIAPDMGGSFGGGVYPEEILIPFAAMRLDVPIRWLEDRTEELSGARHSRDMFIDGELGYSDDGEFEFLDLRIVQDCGAYNPFGITLAYNAAAHARVTYRIDDYSCEGICVLTNKTRNTPVRGAGRPEATFVLERLIDMAARDLDMDPAEIRRRNLISAGSMPFDMGMLYRDGVAMVYDSGDYPAQFEAALAAADYEGLRRRQAEASAEGRFLGVGLACHVEGTGLGPHESASVRIDVDGHVTVHTGAQPHGQGLETTLAQVCADTLGAGLDLVSVKAGDTSLTSSGGGTFGSRSAVTAGSAVHEAAGMLRNRVVDLAARILGIDADRLTVEDGTVSDGDRAIDFGRLAVAAIEDEGSPLEAVAEWTPPTVTFGSGAAVALIEVDPETGLVEVLDYTVVDDCGTILNPMVVDGQLAGGVAHGIGNALLEEARYDSAGQFLTGSFMDYLLPTSLDVPDMTLLHHSHPTPLNPLGVKGVGEGTTSSAPAAVINAVCDALRDFGIEATEMPLTPDRLLALLDPDPTDA